MNPVHAIANIVQVSPTLQTLADAACKGLLLSVIAATVALATRRRSAAARHLVWCAGVVGVLAVPLLAFVLPRWRVPADSLWPISRPAEPDVVAAPFADLTASATTPSSRGRVPGVTHAPHTPPIVETDWPPVSVHVRQGVARPRLSRRTNERPYHRLPWLVR